jgi:hypothetical protein
VSTRGLHGDTGWPGASARARVATRLAKDHPDVVARLVVMDNVPTRIVAREMNAKVAREYWFFMFHQIPDLPEALIAGREDIWLRHFFSDWCHDPMTISGEAFQTYVKAYRAPGAVRGAMSDYRASAEDVAQDLEDAARKIRCPVLSLWGVDFGAVGRLFDMKAIWSEMAENLSVAPIERCGHLPQEEQPEAVNRLLLDFLDGRKRKRRERPCVLRSDKKRFSPADNAPSASTERTDDIAQHQRAHLLGTGSGRHAIALGSARSFEPQGHQIRMRNSAMRRLHRTRRRPSRSVLHVAGGERGLS